MGAEVGSEVGAGVGTSVGATVGEAAGGTVGAEAVGAAVGEDVGMQLVANVSSATHDVPSEYPQVPPASLRSEGVLSLE